jgi:uncharacterized cofD-like protein
VKVVGLGGGHGLAASLRAALTYADEVGAVVTVADDGGSSGRLTRELGIPPPGDIRNCLVAVAADSNLAALYQHRFESGALTGHTAGNILIAALTEMLGDFASAVAEAGKLLRCSGRVYPATTDLVELGAQVDGGRLQGQVAVGKTRSRIQAVFLTPPDPKAHPSAVDAIRSADQVVLGPGSLFTSLIATLLVPGIRKALQDTRARRVFVCNTRMQKGETEGLDAAAHVDALLAHVGAFAVDVVLVQTPEVQPDGVAVDPRALAYSGIDVVYGDMADATGAHDPDRLAKVLTSLS